MINWSAVIILVTIVTVLGFLIRSQPYFDKTINGDILLWYWKGDKRKYIKLWKIMK